MILRFSDLKIPYHLQPTGTLVVGFCHGQIFTCDFCFFVLVSSWFVTGFPLLCPLPSPSVRRWRCPWCVACRGAGASMGKKTAWPLWSTWHCSQGQCCYPGSFYMLGKSKPKLSCSEPPWWHGCGEEEEGKASMWTAPYCPHCRTQSSHASSLPLLSPVHHRSHEAMMWVWHFLPVLALCP